MTDKRPFFSRFDRAAFWTGAALSFLVYFLTCAPTVSLEDCGELATAGDFAGVPHPPGYPTWTMCAWVFARLLSWVTFRGQPNPAWAIAVMSAFWGALACGLTAMLVSRTAADLLGGRRLLNPDPRIPVPSASATGIEAGLADDARDGPIAFLAGVSSALVFAFAPVMWSQSTIVEVYSFGQFFMVLVLLLAYRWMRRPSDRLLVLTSFVFGLGLTNYQVLLLALAPLVLVILLQDIRLFRDFVLTGLPLLLGAGLLKLGALPSMAGFPKHAPLDDFSPVVGAVNLFSKPWTRVVGRDGAAFWTVPPTLPEDISSTHLAYFALVLLVAAALAAFAVLGRLAVLRARGREPSWADSARMPARIVAAGASFLLLVLVLALPGAEPNPYWNTQEFKAFVVRELAAGHPDPVFHWFLPTVAFLLGIAAIWVFALFTSGGLWYAGGCTAALVPLAILMRRGCLLGLAHPLSGYFAGYVALGLGLLALAALLLERGRVVAEAVLAGAAGLLFYAYMPIAGDACPPMNWGYPRTWEGFKHAITRGQYEAIVPESVFTSKFIGQIATYFVDIRAQFTLVLAPLGLVPFAAWSLRRAPSPDGTARRSLPVLPAAVGLAALVAALTVLDRLSGALDLSSVRVDKLLFLVLLLLAAAGLHALLFGQLAPLVRRGFDASLDRSVRLVSFLAGAGILAFVAVAGCCLLNPVAEFAIENALHLDPASSLYFWVDVALTTVLAALWLAFSVYLFVREILRAPAIEPDGDEISERWHLATFVCFVMMSFLLIALANPRGDIQDAFIQKVKFIASHGLYGLWIGYGMAYALRLLRDDRRVRAAFLPACAAIAVAPLLPIHENYFNFELYDKTSAADMDGHDFGWQFGNYQLRGARAIVEELSDDEEPLPNPSYPPEMETNAVFYGGTDPGRFVPTYMIYSAGVRPDVYLITQNALADQTYLDTMRGLYADSIWMPTADDNQVAFGQYWDDIQTGRRPDLGGIRRDASGRMSVNGAQAVMEINGIIARQIFDRNRDGHAFYVEESYAIDWMYPYLVPNGLIMRIRHDPGALPPRAVRDDMDFWDWYVRRLHADPNFAREIPARKAFNKLRGSIAGLYARSRRYREAERAYKEAQSLYVYSPESAFRLVSDILVPEHLFDRAVAELRLLQGLDPNNARIPADAILRLQRADETARTLAARLGSPDNPLSEEETLRLVSAALEIGSETIANAALAASATRADFSPEFPLRTALLLARLGRVREASTMLRRVPDLLASPSISAEDVATAADVHRSAGAFADALELRKLLLRRDATDWRTWIEYAADALAAGDKKLFAIGIQQARQHGGNEAELAIGRRFSGR